MSSGESIGTASGQDFRHDFAVDIREAVVAALEAVREFGVIEAELVQDRGLQVVNVDGLLRDVVADLVGGTVDKSRLNPATG